MVFAQLSDSKLADNAPELVGAAVLIGMMLLGVWRLVSKLQEGQREMVAQFLGHIRESEKKQEQIAKEAREEQRLMAEGNRVTLERVQASLDKNTLMLGKTGAALERATQIIDRLENQMDHGKGEK